MKFINNLLKNIFNFVDKLTRKISSMIKKLHFSVKKACIFFVFFTIQTLYLCKVSAQCAGTDAVLEICTPQNTTSVNLFTLLGTAEVGGTWSDEDAAVSFNPSTGILNPSRVKNSGEYKFTYTVSSGSCNSSATVTVTIGGYAGVSSPDVSACEDDTNFNLFQGFNGNFLAPQFNGVWSDDENTGALNGNFINATAAGLGTHSFTYTVPAIGSCAAQTATVNVSVFKAPEPGTPRPILLCSSDDLSLLTNVNLLDQLTGEDAGGFWTEGATNEITSVTDTRINIQNIYQTRGAGVYSFEYTVFPENPICDEKSATVQIFIEEQLDFSDATLIVNSDICENEIATASYSVTLNQRAKPVPDGNYALTYVITSPSGSVTTSIQDSFLNGVLSFPIPSSQFTQIGDYTVRITSIVNLSALGTCTNVINVSDVVSIYPLPQLSTATITIPSVCVGFAADVQLTDLVNLPNGNYTIRYSISGRNTSTQNSANISVLNNSADFTIPASLLNNDGNSTFTITSIANNVTTCSRTVNLTRAFTIKPLNNLTTFVIAANNACLGQEVTVNLSGLGTLTNITISYNLSGVNVAATQTISLAVVSGTASFILPQEVLINSGATVLTIIDIIDVTEGCLATFTNNSETFTLSAVLVPPPTNGGFTFCKDDEATIANLLPSGSQFQWFTTLDSTTPLATTALLTTTTYYVKEVNPVTGCETSRTPINVVIREVPTPVITNEGQNFCALDNPTVQNLIDATNSTGTVSWYDTPRGTTAISNSDLLVDGKVYYGQTITTEGCGSETISVTVSLLNCEVPADFFIPDGFSPNEDGTNDTFRIPNIEFVYPDYTIEIYNRYGNLMYKGNRNKPNWDGKLSDASVNLLGIAPNGVYFYVIQFNKDGKAPLQGRLYLNR